MMQNWAMQWAIQDYDGPRFQRCDPCQVEWVGIDLESCWNCGGPSLRRRGQLERKSGSDRDNDSEVYER